MEKQTKVIVGFGFVLAAFAATLLFCPEHGER